MTNSAANTETKDDGRGATLIRGVTVVDTRTGSLAPNMSLVLLGDRIQQIVPAGEVPQMVAEEIDAAGKFVVPGYLDMHTHLLQEEHGMRESGMLMLAHGITGTRHMAGSTELLRARRNGTLGLDAYSPEILSLCGEILIPVNAPTVEAGVYEVNRQKTEGADFIKTIFLTPKVFFATLAEANRQGLAYDGHLSPGVSVLQASNAGMKVIEHMGPLELMLIAASSKGWLINFILKMKPPKPPDLSPEAMKAAGKIMIANPNLGRLNADPDALVKTQKLVDSFSEAKARQLAETFAANGTWQCPTLIRNVTIRQGDDPLYTQSPDLRYIRPSTRAFWTKVSEMYTQKVSAAGRETLKRMDELEVKLMQAFDKAGVQMMAGSDYGGGWVIPGVSLHQEFDLLEKAGLSPLKILQMTTLLGAQFLKREADLGTVEVGRLANLVILDNNPIETAQNLHKIFGVVRSGTFYPAQALREMKDHVAGRIRGDMPDAHDAAEQAIP